MGIIVTPKGNRQVQKQFCFDSDVPVEVGKRGKIKFHQYKEQPVGDLAELEKLLATLGTQDNTSLVQGRLKPELRSASGRSDVSTRSSQTYDEPEHPFFFLDVDGVENAFEPATASRQDAETEVEELIEKGFPELGDHCYVFAYTASAGIKPGLRARIIFRLSSVIPLADQKRRVMAANVAVGSKVFDESIYSAAHLIFTAPPYLFINQNSQQKSLPRPVSDVCWLVEREHDVGKLNLSASVLPCTSVQTSTPRAAICHLVR